MKKNLLLTGLLSALLIAGMMFTACPVESDDDDGGNGLPVPGPAELPVLPVGSGYVSSEAEAKALLNDFGTAGVRTLRYEVEELIRSKRTENKDSYTLAVKDDTSLPGLKINATGNATYRLNPPDFMQDGYIPKAGDSMGEDQTSDTTVEFTADKSAGGATVYKGSRISEKSAESSSVTIEKIDTASQSGTVNFAGSGSSFHVYSLTVSGGGKGGKIILNAQVQGSGSKTITVSDENFDFPDIPVTYSGSLTVYGANDTAVYTKNISGEADYNEVMAYF